MEIRQVVRGTDTSFAAARPPQRGESQAAGPARPAADRVELSRRWVEEMQEQSARIQALLTNPAGREEEDEGGILGYMKTEEDKLDGLSEGLDIQMKCLKIAMNIMKGKKVPPEDERYLMEHDPNGYKLAMAMKAMVKEDKKECKSVLDDEDKNGKAEEAADGGEPAPAEGASGGGEAASSAEGDSAA